MCAKILNLWIGVCFVKYLLYLQLERRNSQLHRTINNGLYRDNLRMYWHELYICRQSSLYLKVGLSWRRFMMTGNTKRKFIVSIHLGYKCNSNLYVNKNRRCMYSSYVYVYVCEWVCRRICLCVYGCVYPCLSMCSSFNLCVKLM